MLSNYNVSKRNSVSLRRFQMFVCAGIWKCGDVFVAESIRQNSKLIGESDEDGARLCSVKVGYFQSANDVCKRPVN